MVWRVHADVQTLERLGVVLFVEIILCCLILYLWLSLIEKSFSDVPCLIITLGFLDYFMTFLYAGLLSVNSVKFVLLAFSSYLLGFYLLVSPYLWSDF